MLELWGTVNWFQQIVAIISFLPDVIFHEQGEGEEFGYTTGEHNYRAMNLSTSGGTIQLLFEENNTAPGGHSSVT